MSIMRHIIEAAALHVLFLLFRLLPVDSASALGGWLGRTVGSRLAASRKALRNLERAMPDLDEQARQRIMIDMWDNLGRVFAEYPHLSKIISERVRVHNPELLKHDNGAILFGGHIGNWEVGACFAPLLYDMPLDITYRAPNNPFADKLLLKSRLISPQIKAHAKSRGAGKALIEALKAGRMVGVLLDQKYNEGIAVPFFGREAMTNPVFVQLAQKYSVPMIPARCVREGGAHFRIEVFEPLALLNEDGTARGADDVLREINIMLEEWIKDEPAQWLWLHRRWDKTKP